jgi:hypothetical protein
MLGEGMMACFEPGGPVLNGMADVLGRVGD